MERIAIATSRREEMIDVTRQIRRIAGDCCWKNGVLTVFCPHTTCGITINEGFDPDVALDMTAFMSELIPRREFFRHAEGNSDAHIKASMIGSSIQLLIEDGQILLGTWQALWLYEGDGPRRRELWLKWMGE